MDQFKVRAVYSDDNKMLISSRTHNDRKKRKRLEKCRHIRNANINDHHVHTLVSVDFLREIQEELNVTVVNVISEVQQTRCSADASGSQS